MNKHEFSQEEIRAVCIEARLLGEYESRDAALLILQARAERDEALVRIIKLQDALHELHEHRDNSSPTYTTSYFFRDDPDYGLTEDEDEF